MTFDLQFPSQSMVTGYVKKHTFDKEFFCAPKIGIEEDDTSNLSSPAAIIWDVLEPTQGMTTVSALDANPVVIAQRVRKTKTYKPLYCRECVVLSEAQLTLARRMGSSVARAGSELVYDAVDQLNERIDTFLEAKIFESLSGKLKINEKERVDYEFTTAQTPNVSTTSGYGGQYWTNSNAVPVADLRKATEILRYKGARGIRLVCDISVMSLLSQRCEDLFKQSQFAASLGPEKLRDLLPGLLGCGITEVIISTQGYVDEDGTSKPFADPKKCYLVGIPARGEKIGAFRSVPSIYSGLDDAKAGRFIKIDNEFERTSGAVPRVTITGGIYGLPVLYRPDLVVCMQVTA